MKEVGKNGKLMPHFKEYEDDDEQDHNFYYYLDMDFGPKKKEKLVSIVLQAIKKHDGFKKIADDVYKNVKANVVKVDTLHVTVCANEYHAVSFSSQRSIGFLICNLDVIISQY